MTGWERLHARQLPVERVVLPLDPPAYAAAVQDGQSPDALPVLAFEVRTLPPAAWEELVDQHPPTPEQQALDWGWDPRTLRIPALAAAVTLAGEAPLTAQQWAEHVDAGRLSSGELDLLLGEVVRLNARASRVSLGKG